jgi:FkbM family methyltransferase
MVRSFNFFGRSFGAGERSTGESLRFRLGAVRRKVLPPRYEKFRINGHVLRYVDGTCPVNLDLANSDDVISQFDALQLKLFIEHLREGDTAFDIGANIGTYTLIMAAQCGHSGRVVAFEPNPACRDIFDRNMALNPEVKTPTVEAIAVSDTCSEAVLYSRGGIDSQASLTQQPNNDESTRTQTISLDEYLARHPGYVPRLIKIDVEGAEIKILKGARTVLESDAVILCELHPNAWQQFGDTFADLKMLVKAAGRRIRYINEPREIGEQATYGVATFERL